MELLDQTAVITGGTAGIDWRPRGCSPARAPTARDRPGRPDAIAPRGSSRLTWPMQTR